MIAGMDEAGRGPAIGPLVFGIVVVTEEQEKELIDLGVNDSKKLTKKKREEFREVIKETVSYHETLAVSATEISRLMGKMTLNEIEVNHFRKLLEPYRSKVDLLQLDAADVNAERFGQQFRDLVEGEIDSKHKGDSIFVSVGAASILAKTRRDEIIEELQQSMIKFDPDLPSFGSGYPTQARPFLEAYVKSYGTVPEIARTKWKTSTDALEKYGEKQQSLDDFDF